MATPTPLRDKLSINPEDQMMDVADTPAALRNYQHQASRVEFLSFYWVNRAAVLKRNIKNINYFKLNFQYKILECSFGFYNFICVDKPEEIQMMYAICTVKRKCLLREIVLWVLSELSNTNVCGTNLTYY